MARKGHGWAMAGPYGWAMMATKTGGSSPVVKTLHVVQSCSFESLVRIVRACQGAAKAYPCSYSPRVGAVMTPLAATNRVK